MKSITDNIKSLLNEEGRNISALPAMRFIKGVTPSRRNTVNGQRKIRREADKKSVGEIDWSQKSISLSYNRVNLDLSGKFEPEVIPVVEDSNYSLQFNPNNLNINSSSPSGTVDSLGNISSVISTDAEFSDELTQSTLSSQPELIVDYFGSGSNAMLFNGSSDYLLKTDTSFTPDWDEEFWVAFNFKTTNKANNCIFHIGQGIAFGGGPGLRFQFSATGNISFVLVSSNSGSVIAKNHSTEDDYANNVQYSLIYHHKGTNTITDDDFYVNGTIVSSTTTRDDDFTGKTIYPFAQSINQLLGVRSDLNAVYSGYLGKIITGFGAPNATAITNDLNSTS